MELENTVFHFLGALDKRGKHFKNKNCCASFFANPQRRQSPCQIVTLYCNVHSYLALCLTQDEEM